MNIYLVIALLYFRILVFCKETARTKVIIFYLHNTVSFNFCMFPPSKKPFPLLIYSLIQNKCMLLVIIT